MKEKVEVGHEEVPSRHPLAALPFAAILTFVGRQGAPESQGPWLRLPAGSLGSDC